MVTVLVVDDDAQKQQRVGVVARELIGDDLDLLLASTAADAIDVLERKHVDLLVLDLNLPRRQGEEPRADGGVHLLRQLTGQKPAVIDRWKVPSHIMGMTAFDELRNSCVDEFERHGWLIVKYVGSSDAWEESLARRLVHIAKSKSAMKEDGYGVDVAVITALTSVELEAVLQLDASWVRKRVERDETVYHEGRISNGGMSLGVVASAAIQMGMPAASAHAMKVIEVFRPRYLVITGIAAGVAGNPGDVLIADQTWDYGSGKNRLSQDGKAVFLPAPQPIPLDVGLKAQLSYFALRSDVLLRIRSRWTGEHAAGPIRVHIGPIASGAAVLENEELVGELKLRDRKLLGIEMETYGVFVAASVSRHPRPKVFSVKSICDWGNTSKHDKYQNYAAFTAAQFLYEFARSELLSNSV